MKCNEQKLQQVTQVTIALLASLFCCFGRFQIQECGNYKGTHRTTFHAYRT